MSKYKQILLSGVIGLISFGSPFVGGVGPEDVPGFLTKIGQWFFVLPARPENPLNSVLIKFVLEHSGLSNAKEVKKRLESRSEAMANAQEWHEKVIPDVSSLKDIKRIYGKENLLGFDGNVLLLLEVASELFGQLCLKRCKEKFKCSACWLFPIDNGCDDCLCLRYTESCQGENKCAFCFYESTFLRMFNFVECFGGAVGENIALLLEDVEYDKLAEIVENVASRLPMLYCSKMAPLGFMIEKCCKHVCLFLALKIKESVDLKYDDFFSDQQNRFLALAEKLAIS